LLGSNPFIRPPAAETPPTDTPPKGNGMTAPRARLPKKTVYWRPESQLVLDELRAELARRGRGMWSESLAIHEALRRVLADTEALERWEKPKP